MRTRGFVPYAEAGSWAAGIDSVITSVERLLTTSEAEAAIALCESALKSLSKAIHHVDDSDGNFQELRDRLEHIHHRACQQCAPNAIALAKRLFAIELRSDFDIFDRAAARYADILGPAGMAAYRKLAEAEWTKVPPRDHRSKGIGRDHFRITRIMETLAKLTGDVEQIVAVLRRDLSHPYDYLQIAEAYRDAGRMDASVYWAEQGVQIFSQRPDSRLQQFLAHEYHRLGRHQEAMHLAWAIFADRPCLETYGQLEKHARQAEAWPIWREKAIAEIRKRAERDNTLLVEIALHEGDADWAWTEAQAGCSAHVLFKVAEQRQRTHPGDAGRVYLSLAQREIPSSRYEGAVQLLVKAAALMAEAGQRDDFAEQLDKLRTKYKLKRNLIREIECYRKVLYFE
ncbi:MAG: hypothetical protein JNK87_29300 [Bryobacterales bacterium]|nr:hypothetical protein [Bryobacterales bacterium]